MMDSPYVKGVSRISRIADMLCTAHANLRDQYARFALLVDLSILLASVWLTAIAFVDPKIEAVITPGSLNPRLWSGVLGIAVFGLSLLQLKVDWKGRSDAHRRALEQYAEVKREAQRLLDGTHPLTEDSYKSLSGRNDRASTTAIAIPESEFLKQKQAHHIKIVMSKYLDEHPASSLNALRVRLWWRDTFS